MQETLDKVRIEIEEYLRANNFVVFQGQSRVYDEAPIVYWDTKQCPEYLEFIKTAEAAGVRFVVLHSEIFDDDSIEDLENGLEGLELPNSERRAFEKRIQEFGAYTGMVSSIELSYTFDNQVYLLGLEARWYNDYEDLYEELMLTGSGLEEDAPEEPPMGGFFSKN